MRTYREGAEPAWVTRPVKDSGELSNIPEDSQIEKPLRFPARRPESCSYLLGMKTQQGPTVVGVFQDSLHANQAIAELHEAGFDKSQVGIAMRHGDGLADDVVTEKGTHAESGAVTGALTGLGLGALAGLGVLAGVIPVVGPAIAAGTLGVILSNAAAGAGIVGLVGALVGAGIPEHEAKYYQQEFEAGHAIVSVIASGRATAAADILRRHGAYDMSSRKAVSVS